MSDTAVYRRHGSASCSALANFVTKVAASRRAVSFLPLGSRIGSLNSAS
jgi:hypothetical protein